MLASHHHGSIDRVPPVKTQASDYQEHTLHQSHPIVSYQCRPLPLTANIGPLAGEAVRSPLNIKATGKGRNNIKRIVQSPHNYKVHSPPSSRLVITIDNQPMKADSLPIGLHCQSIVSEETMIVKHRVVRFATRQHSESAASMKLSIKMTILLSSPHIVQVSGWDPVAGVSAQECNFRPAGDKSGCRSPGYPKRVPFSVPFCAVKPAVRRQFQYRQNTRGSLPDVPSVFSRSPGGRAGPGAHPGARA